MPCLLALGFIEVWNLRSFFRKTLTFKTTWSRTDVSGVLSRKACCVQNGYFFMRNRSGCQGPACWHWIISDSLRSFCVMGLPYGSMDHWWMFLFRSSLPVVFIDLHHIPPQEQWSIIKHSTSPHIRTHSSASSQQGNTWTVKKDTLVVWFIYGVLYSLFLWASTAPEELTCPADISHLPTSNPSFFQGRTESCGCFPGSIYIYRDYGINMV